MKLLFFLGAFLTSNAFAGGADFDAYMKANARNPVLTKKSRNQEAFTPKRAYYPTQDPKVAGAKSETAFKMGGTNTPGSFGGASSSGNGGGTFKPTAVTTKPATLTPNASGAETTASTFGIGGVSPTNSYASNPSGGDSSGATSGSTVQSSETAAAAGDTGATTTAVNSSAETQAPADAAQVAAQVQQNGYYPSAYRSTQGVLIDNYVNQADQLAQQRYNDSQTAAYQAEHGYYPSAYHGNGSGESQTAVDLGNGWVSDGANGMMRSAYYGSGSPGSTQPAAPQRQPAAAAPPPSPQQVTTAQRAAQQTAEQVNMNVIGNIMMMH